MKYAFVKYVINHSFKCVPDWNPDKFLDIESKKNLDGWPGFKACFFTTCIIRV